MGTTQTVVNWNLHVSPGNSKLGDVPNVSLPPILSCDPNVKCAQDCYAVNIVKRFRHVRALWEGNLKYYETAPQNFFADIHCWLIRNNPSHFRWHVGGDCPDKKYLKEVYTISRSMPHIKFMMYTKRYSWVNKRTIPDNINVLLSMWPYMLEPYKKQQIKRIPKTWVRGDLRAPKDIFVCKGQCTSCYQCWDKSTKNILLKGH